MSCHNVQKLAKQKCYVLLHDCLGVQIQRNYCYHTQTLLTAMKTARIPNFEQELCFVVRWGDKKDTVDEINSARLDSLLICDCGVSHKLCHN